MLPSIGGGVCQTATTLFNDAFELGLPILERTNHNLYLAHYPIGRDATVSWGGPDFKFRNDLKHGLLIKTSYTDSTLTFTFYGTNEQRRVVAHTGPQTNWTRPSMNYAVDPERAARLGQGRRRHRRAGLRRHGRPQGLRREREASSAQQRLQLALHPGQPDHRLRPRAGRRPARTSCCRRRSSMARRSGARSREHELDRLVGVVGDVQQLEVVGEIIPSASSSPLIQSIISPQ